MENNSVWGNIFSKREPYWVIVTLKSGRKIAGKYGKNSHASEDPEQREIYLEEVYKMDADGLFADKTERTGGILIAGIEISTIEFFK